MKKKNQPIKPYYPNFYLEVERLEINSNRTAYLTYKVMNYKLGVPRQIAKATINLFKELRRLGFSGDIKMSLDKDRMLQWERD